MFSTLNPTALQKLYFPPPASRRRRSASTANGANFSPQKGKRHERGWPLRLAAYCHSAGGDARDDRDKSVCRCGDSASPGNPRLMPAAASEWPGPVHSANGGSSPLVRWLSGRLRERGGILQRRLAAGRLNPDQTMPGWRGACAGSFRAPGLRGWSWRCAGVRRLACRSARAPTRGRREFRRR